MNLKSQLESILFIHGEPLALSRLAKATGAPKKDVETALGELAGEYTRYGTGRGIVLIENGDEWQLATHPANKKLVETFVSSGRAEELTRAGLEVLTVIAYKGPISRATVEYIRGVDSSFTLRNLLMRGLLERGENPNDKRSYLYRVSTNFLKHLGLARIEELPQFSEFKQANINPPPEAGSEIPAP